LRHRGDLVELADAADVRDVGLYDRDGVVDEQLA